MAVVEDQRIPRGLDPSAGRSDSDESHPTTAVTRTEAYRHTVLAIARYLAERQQMDGRFPGPDHYGVASAVWLWSHLGDGFDEQIERGRHRLQRCPPPDHGELNAYALLHCRRELGADRIDPLVQRIGFGGRHSANWMLLRSVCRARPGPFFSPFLSNLEARAALIRYARRGFVADRSGVRSLAYHAFCGALLADLWRHREWRWAGRAAVRAADAAAAFVLPNGDGLYIGRGQEQIFGYGALLYLLEFAAQATGRAALGGAAGRALQHLQGFQRTDGSFPLVLREGEVPDPWKPDSSRPGWYTYNRYADYLPFLGCMLLKASDAAAPAVDDVAPVAQHRQTRVRRERDYVAVLSEPGGASTNDLPFPYVCVRGESLFPCYGSEGDEAEPGAVPLPYGTLTGGTRYCFRSRLRYRLMEDSLIGASRLVRHVRRFRFSEDGFACRDEILFRRRCRFAGFVPANFLFRDLRDLGGGEFESRHGDARAKLRLTPEGRMHRSAAVTATGPLVALRNDRGPIETKRGDVFTTELSVEFL
jgi:hypothetical protein